MGSIFGPLVFGISFPEAHGKDCLEVLPSIDLCGSKGIQQRSAVLAHASSWHLIMRPRVATYNQTITVFGTQLQHGQLYSRGLKVVYSYSHGLVIWASKWDQRPSSHCQGRARDSLTLLARGDPKINGSTKTIPGPPKYVVKLPQTTICKQPKKAMILHTCGV